MPLITLMNAILRWHRYSIHVEHDKEQWILKVIWELSPIPNYHREFKLSTTLHFNTLYSFPKTTFFSTVVITVKKSFKCSYIMVSICLVWWLWTIVAICNIVAPISNTQKNQSIPKLFLLMQFRIKKSLVQSKKTSLYLTNF